MTDGFAVVDPEDVAAEQFPESGLAHRKLTGPLGCTETRVNAVTLGPGEATAPHSHERQEEVYVALDGGRIRVDDETHDVPPGGVVRIGPDPVRSVRNDTDDASQTWLMVGAPPVGTVEDFGEYVTPSE
jgi:quercetin dioxygenase-like cupin family protein